MKNYKITYNEENHNFEINNIQIDNEIFQEEKVGYTIAEREQQINDLYMWIGEATGSDRTSDLYLMKEDLHYLESLEDEYIFSNTSTNEFVAKSDDEKEFNDICEEILKLNKELNLKNLKECKGYKYEFYYGGYRIYFEDRTDKYSPLAGNKLLNISQDEREKKLYNKIRYEINKHIKELK